MKRLIDAIIAKWFTVPEWELIHENRLYLTGESEKNGDYPVVVRQTYMCKKTGRFKKIVL